MSSQPDHKLELESQFVLRLPPAQAEVLRQAVRTGEPLSKRLSVKFDNDIRYAMVKLDNWTMPARLYDLPTIIESYKTLDRKNFYKTADVSQILICKEIKQSKEDSDLSDVHEDDDEETKKNKYDKLFSSIGGVGKREFLFPHGITPPLKNVRKRRFRKTLKKKYVDFSEIEKEVKRLFRFDCEAIESRYEIVEESKADKVQPTTFANENEPSPMNGGPMGMQSTENSQNIDLNELFGEDYSSSDDAEDDDDDEDDADGDEDIDLEQDNDKDNEQEDNMDFDDESMPPPESNQVPAADIAAETAAASDLIALNDDQEEKLLKLNEELAKIRERIQDQESKLAGLDNQALMMRLQPLLDNLHEQEKEILKQIDEQSNQM